MNIFNAFLQSTIGLLLFYNFNLYGKAGDVHGRDLNTQIGSFLGHVGIEDDHGKIYEMMGDIDKISAYGVSTKLAYNSIDDFRNLTPNYWGSKYLRSLQLKPDDINKIMLKFANYAYQVGSEYTITAKYRDPKGVIKNGEKIVITKGKYRCDTFIWRLYKTVGKELSFLGASTPSLIYNRLDGNRNLAYEPIDEILINSEFINIKYLKTTTEAYINLSTNQRKENLIYIIEKEDFVNDTNLMLEVAMLEEDEILFREIIMYLIDSFHSDKSKYNNKIKEIITSLVHDKNKSNEILKLDIGPLFTPIELEKIFVHNEKDMSFERKILLSNIYINNIILNEGHLPNSKLQEFIDENFSSKEIEDRKKLISDFQLNLLKL